MLLFPRSCVPLHSLRRVPKQSLHQRPDATMGVRFRLEPSSGSYALSKNAFFSQSRRSRVVVVSRGDGVGQRERYQVPRKHSPRVSSSREILPHTYRARFRCRKKGKETREEEIGKKKKTYGHFKSALAQETDRGFRRRSASCASFQKNGLVQFQRKRNAQSLALSSFEIHRQKKRKKREAKIKQNKTKKRLKKTTSIQKKCFRSLFHRLAVVFEQS